MTPEENCEEIEVWEFALDDGEIDELIEKLKELKQTKKNFEFDIDEDNQLLIHHLEDVE